MKISLVPDNKINEIIIDHLVKFGKLHILVDPKINDNFFFQNDFDFESILPIRDRQDTISADHECLQLCTISKQSITDNTLFKIESVIDNIIQNLSNKQSAAIAILFSKYSNSEIQKQISNAMFMSYCGEYYLFRFYDPHVLKHLVTIFSNTQICKLLGVIEYWYYWDEAYIELYHQPKIIISDIDYRIDVNQWQQLKLAQDFNAYEYQIIRQQKRTLTAIQKNTLIQLLNRVNRVKSVKPEKEKLDLLVTYAMAMPEQFLEKTKDNLFFDLINKQDIDQIKQFLK